MNSLNNLKTKAIIKGGQEASVKLNKQIMGNLQTILILIKQNWPKKLKDRTPNTILTTDASEDSWGWRLDQFNEQKMGHWPIGMFLESRLQQFERTSSSVNLAKKPIVNISRLVNEMHPTQDGQYKQRMRERFLLLNNIDIMTYMEHLPGLKNSTADALSRLSWIADCQINPVFIIEALLRITFQPTLDAFAHKTNMQLKRYCSPQEDNNTIARNALNIPWTSEQLLLHPPIGLISKVIQKTIRDQEEAVLILPRWCLYKYRTMLPPIQNQITLISSDQILTKGKTMKEFTKLSPGIIETIKINPKKENNYFENLQNQQSQTQQLQTNLLQASILRHGDKAELVLQDIDLGGFGNVYLVFSEELGTSAVKIMRKSDFNYDEWKTGHIHGREGNNPFVLKYHAANMIGDNVIILMEYANMGNLKYLIETNKHLPLPYIRVIMKQLLEGLRLMHEKGLIHRDLKAENIMLHCPLGSGRVQLKIANFGQVKVQKNVQQSTHMDVAGTDPYMPPELLGSVGGEIKADSKVDIWSAGILLHQLASHQFPFESLTQQSIIMFMIAKKLDKPTSIYSDQLWNLITQMLSFDIKERISAAEALNHEFFTGEKADEEISINAFRLAQAAQKALKKGDKNINQYDLDPSFTFAYTDAKELINKDPEQEIKLIQNKFNLPSVSNFISPIAPQSKQKQLNQFESQQHSFIQPDKQMYLNNKLESEKQKGKDEKIQKKEEEQERRILKVEDEEKEKEQIQIIEEQKRREEEELKIIKQEQEEET
ncbi:MAG: putative AGC family protein kinase [Streblomastix strix]|uniref:Putative AGC family protein kinase n=1 Tax=Streblomastix strix TaxID=222440 RepID=A0A5J4WMJ3_9EUKA|nr:MAG: putative AGC family protein kinase [Streblomastix strix]